MILTIDQTSSPSPFIDQITPFGDRASSDVDSVRRQEEQALRSTSGLSERRIAFVRIRTDLFIDRVNFAVTDTLRSPSPFSSHVLSVRGHVDEEHRGVLNCQRALESTEVDTVVDTHRNPPILAV